jgi:hypothetical protein
MRAIRATVAGCVAAGCWAGLVAPGTTILAAGIDPPIVLRSESRPSTVHINDIRLEAPVRRTAEPASVLKFEMLNDGERRITDVMLEIAIREKASDVLETPRTIVGPFLVGGHATIEAGYAVDYELLLKNLAPDCSCSATVRVVSARELPEP